MIRYVLRTLPVLLRARVAQDGARISRITRRVRLHEIDANRHMNQAVYAQVCELGRVDWFVRSGSWQAFTAQGVHPVVAEQRLVYRRELAPFARYDIDTRAVAVSGRLLELQSLLVVGDRVHTQCDVRSSFLVWSSALRAQQRGRRSSPPHVSLPSCWRRGLRKPIGWPPVAATCA